MYCLSVEQINRISPYKVEIASDGNSLIFYTRYGLTYEVGFVEDYTFFDENTYQFFIVEKSGNRFLKDSLVKLTVWTIIEAFFKRTVMCFFMSVILRMASRQYETAYLIFGLMNMKGGKNICILQLK